MESRSLTRDQYRAAYHAARLDIRRAVRDRSVWIGGVHIADVWAYYIDTGDYPRAPSALAEAVSIASTSGRHFVGRHLRRVARDAVSQPRDRLPLP